MTHKCELIERSAQPVLSIRTRTAVQNLPQVFGDVYGKIMQYLGELGETPAGAPYAAYYNMDMQDLDVEIGFPVMSALPGKGDIQASHIPAGKAATCMHTGPYSEIASAYNDLSAWITAQGLQPTGVAYEFYINDPQHTPPAELQTLILFPLA